MSGSPEEQVDDLPPFLAADNLKHFIPDDLKESTSPIIFKARSGQKSYGYDARLLPKVCEVSAVYSSPSLLLLWGRDALPLLRRFPSPAL